MKIQTQYFSLIFFVILFGCNKKEASKSFDNSKVVIEASLVKAKTDTLSINWRGTRSREEYPFNYFNDTMGICNLFGDTIIISTSQGYGPSNSLKITISNQKFLIDLSEHNCTYSHKYKIIRQELTLNKSRYKIGDTLIGKLYCEGLYVGDSLRNIVDTTTISGKFKLEIRGKGFNWDSLNQEKNYEEYLKALTCLRPDTVTRLNFSYSGLYSLTEDLRKFKNLEILELENNNFSNADLSVLKEFEKLKVIELNHCQLKKIPSSILELRNLERIGLFNNDIEILPVEISNLRKLRELQLGGNSLNSLPNEIIKLEKLEMVDISGSNDIKKLPPNFFNSLKNLRRFYGSESLEK